MPTLVELYLGSEPTSVSVQDDQVLLGLDDGRWVALPLEVVSQLSHQETLPAETEVLILRRPPQIDHVHVTESALNVYLKDGRVLSSPLAWFPRLRHGTPAERNHYQLQGDDDVIHWPDLDEDIELLSLFQGGTSIESESSIQRWLQSRVTAPAL